MARRPRADSPGSWHHVINRGIAKRPYFETRSDKRYFLARVASEVRAGRLEVHASSLMHTHFHLLVRSPVGELSEAMRRLQCAYSRHFNRRRRRDGPLIRARFYSKRVDSETYRRAVVSYIDANAVRAGVVSSSAAHEFGSARAYVRGVFPRWLSTQWVVRKALERAETTEFSAAAYVATFGPRNGEDRESLCQLVEARMASSAELDPLDDLIGKTPGQVRRWMKRKALLADGMEVGLPVCGAAAVLRVVRRCLGTRGEWIVDHAARTWRGSSLAQAGLLRDLCCMPILQIARVCEASRWDVDRRVAVHRRLMREDRDYAEAVSALVHEALGATMAA